MTLPDKLEFFARCLRESRIWEYFADNQWYPGDEDDIGSVVEFGFEVRIKQPPPPPVWQPWTFETRPLDSVWVRPKDSDIRQEELVLGWNVLGAAFHDTGRTYANLLNEFITREGSPCGTLKYSDK